MKIKQLLHVGVLITLIPLGIYTKFYNGLFDNWVHNSLGGVLYEVFWVLLFSLLFKKISAILITVTVFVLTSGLEFLQLVKFPILQQIRSTFLGQVLIGNSFNSTDFIYYVLGCLIGWFLLRLNDKY